MIYLYLSVIKYILYIILNFTSRCIPQFSVILREGSMERRSRQRTYTWYEFYVEATRRNVILPEHHVSSLDP